MKNTKTQLLGSSLLWFGAAVSIAEIMTGTLFVPLGFSKGIIAIILGHIIGCILLYFAGLIGAKRNMSSMETVGISFGSKGTTLFAILNVLQLAGWTAVMIIGGARAMGTILNPVFHINGVFLWCIVTGLLIILWIAVGINNLTKLNIFAVGGLFLLTIILSIIVFKGGNNVLPTGTISFGAAVELAAAMPLSWLPLISDYTRGSKAPKTASFTSTISYFIGSCWMYIIGLGACLFTGQSDIGQIMMSAGLGTLGVLIIILSTVTTTFLDAYSAGVSFMRISDKISEKWVAIIVCILGTILAIFTPIEQYQNFLYLIGSVFAPMIAILVTDFFILGCDHTKEKLNVTNIILWAAGFIIYRMFMSVNTVIGSTVPVMVIISILCILINGGKKYVERNSGKH